MTEILLFQSFLFSNKTAAWSASINISKPADVILIAAAVLTSSQMQIWL